MTLLSPLQTSLLNLARSIEVVDHFGQAGRIEAQFCPAESGGGRSSCIKVEACGGSKNNGKQSFPPDYGFIVLFLSDSAEKLENHVRVIDEREGERQWNWVELDFPSRYTRGSVSEVVAHLIIIIIIITTIIIMATANNTMASYLIPLATKPRQSPCLLPPGDSKA